MAVLLWRDIAIQYMYIHTMLAFYKPRALFRLNCLNWPFIKIMMQILFRTPLYCYIICILTYLYKSCRKIIWYQLFTNHMGSHAAI